MLFTLLEARMVEIHCGEEGGTIAEDMRRGVLTSGAEAPRTAADALEAEGFELDAGSALGAKLLEEQERAEADAWYAENGDDE